MDSGPRDFRAGREGGRHYTRGVCLPRFTGEEEQATIQRLFQKLSVALMKGNAALFNNRNPSDMGIEEEELTW